MLGGGGGGVVLNVWLSTMIHSVETGAFQTVVHKIHDWKSR